MCLLSSQNCSSPAWAWGSRPLIEGIFLTPAFLHGHLSPVALQTGILSSWLGLARQLGQDLSPREGGRRQVRGWMEGEEGEGQFRVVETLLEPERSRFKS